MIKRSFLIFSALLAAGALLFGCAMTSQPPATMYGLKPMSFTSTDRTLSSDVPALAIFYVSAPDWLNNTMMYYRQMHMNEQQIRFYTLSRWSMSPPELFRERLKSRIVVAGGTIGGGKKYFPGQLRLMVHIEDFSQHFQDDLNSEGRMALRVSILGKEEVLAQKHLFIAVPAATPDAPGGAHALSTATDELITEILTFIAKSCQEGHFR
jgi:cholesterol transport system auxiliary component